MAAFRLLVCCVLLFFPLFVNSIPEPGKLTMSFNKDGQFNGFSKALYKGATIRARGKCSPLKDKSIDIIITWKLKYSLCADGFFAFAKKLDQLWNYGRQYELSGTDTITCNGQKIHFKDFSDAKEFIEPTTEAPLNGTKTTLALKKVKPTPTVLAKKVEGKEVTTPEENSSQRRRKRAEDQPEGNIDNNNDVQNSAESSSSPTTISVKVIKTKQKSTAKTIIDKTDKPEKATDQQLNSPPDKKKTNTNRITTTKRDGIFMLVVKVDSDNLDDKFDLELEISMESKSGYLSATDWPLLPFYGVMSLVYLFYGIVWLVVSACQWRDLLRIQFWVGGVIALGMLEKAVFYSEYNNINNTGLTNPSLVVFAEVVSVAKRTLARMLVIIVSMGFGIVKPRLGKSLHRVLGVGALYFVLGVVEGSMRSLSFKADPSKEQLVAGIPLAVLDAAICWWIFMSLVQTTRTLRIRRNVVKLSLYRHFTNILIFAVLASVAYMVWSIKTHKLGQCIEDWTELWLDEAFWHFLFSILLLVIMILWRPTANNQRYAFTPIVDFDDDDEEDNVTLSEAFDGMKMRNTRTEVVVGSESKKKAEDDLKWVEENIPSSAADTVLPSVLDSDEELMTTKFEMSKMD